MTFECVRCAEILHGWAMSSVDGVCERCAEILEYELIEDEEPDDDDD